MVAQPVLHGLRVHYLHRPYRREAVRGATWTPLPRGRIAHWERAATMFGGALFLTIALGCIVAFDATDDAFSRLLCVCLALSNALGIVGRSFALAWLVRTQLLCLCVPFTLAMLLSGDPWMWVLALFAVPFAVVTYQLTVRLRRDLVGVVRERETAERTATRFSATLAAIPDIVIHLTPNGFARVANAAARDLFPDLEGERIRFAEALRRNSLFAPSDVQRLIKLVDGTTERASVEAFRIGDGRILDVTTVREKTDDTLLVMSDVTERERALAATIAMAREDHLTGLASRAWFIERATEMLAERTEGELPALAVFDVDGFKALNDTLGHRAGDSALRVLASLLSAACRSGTIAARHGGDEFALLTVGDRTHREAFLIDVVGIVSDFAMRFRESPVRLSASAGVSEDGATIDALLASADLALFDAKIEAKRTGQRGLMRVFDEAMRERTERRERMKVLLAASIETGEGIEVVYQPIVDPLRGRIVGAEALCRWSHPEFGPVPPPVFIELAEELGVIRQLTDTVLRRATGECTHWPDDVSVSVNLSAIDLEVGDLASRVRGALDRADLSPDRLQLEITETRAIRGDHDTQSLLRTLADGGIALALDDFGTGFSNLAMVASLPLRTLKIDRSLVSSIEDERCFTLLSGAIRMFTDMGLRIVVEGIETEEQLDLLASLGGTPLVQGYLFGRPMPASQLRVLIDRGIPARRELAAS